MTAVDYRAVLTTEDVSRVEAVTRATGFFTAEEVAIAVELATENLEQGPERSEYYFLLLDDAASGQLRGYACYGPIPGTRGRFDLYWIVVAPSAQGRGVGRELLRAVERHVRGAGGSRLYADTSSRAQYAPTRAFYERCGFTQEAVLEGYYDDGDGKVLYCKRL